jgi:hypothetical protein
VAAGAPTLGADLLGRQAPPAPPRFRGERVLGAGFGLLLALVAVFAFGVGLGIRGTDIAIYALALLTLFVASIPLLVDRGLPLERRHVMLSVLSLVYLAHFVVPALTIYIPAVGPIDASSTSNTNLFPHDVVDGQLVALLAVIVLLVAYALPFGKVFAQMLPAPTRDWPLVASLGISAAMIPVGWGIVLGGLLGWIPESVGTGVVGTIASSSVYANILLTTAVVRNRSRVAVPLIALNIVVSGLYGMITTRKRDMLLAAALVALTLVVLRGRIRVIWIALGIAALIAIYPVSEFLRGGIGSQYSIPYMLSHPLDTLMQVQRYLTGADTAELLDSGLQATGRRIDGLGILSVIVRDTPSVSPYQYGRTLGLFFVAFIPRLLWPDKPEIHIGQWVTDVYGSGPEVVGTSTGPTQVGEFYFNFGWPGVVLGMLLLGVLLRFTFEWLVRRGGTTPAILAAVTILYWLGVKFMGDVALTYSSLVVALVPILATHALVRLLGASVPRTPAAAAPAAPADLLGLGAPPAPGAAPGRPGS